MESSAASSLYRLVNFKGGVSHSYLLNNLAKSDTYVAVVKNGHQQSRIQIFKLNQLENDSL